ncbi:MAG: FAD-dependent oxidoreductase [Pseudomarimonas sp.]
MRPQRITIAGAGLAGALLATLLAKRGIAVDVFERRADPRIAGYEGGRSINLALAERGRHALEQADTAAAVMQHAVMMRGRMVHAIDGQTQLQRYGRDDSEVIWSIHRGRLNLDLLNAAQAAGARLHFGQRLHTVDFDTGSCRLQRENDGVWIDHAYGALVGADGAGSAMRAALAGHVDLNERFEHLGHGYKELEIPPNADGSYRIEPNALHIWPRGGYMCIALPNSAGTFTVTLFLPNDGGESNTAGPSFADLTNDAEVAAFFARDFADAVPLMPELLHDFSHNPLGQLGTLRLSRWHLDGRAVLLGDAAHAMVPFHGQGMNCAFEDCVALAEAIDKHADLADAFAHFEAERRPNADAIQTMALENYIEMRDRVDDADFLLQRQLERVLAERHPQRFVPRYSMVTFRRTPYAVALARGAIQRALLVEATRGHTCVETIDLELADQRVREALAVLS